MSDSLNLAVNILCVPALVASVLGCCALVFTIGGSRSDECPAAVHGLAALGMVLSSLATCIAALIPSAQGAKVVLSCVWLGFLLFYLGMLEYRSPGCLTGCLCPKKKDRTQLINGDQPRSLS